MHASNMQPDRLRRAIGRWSLAALMLNTMIGGSAFGLPSLLVARLGKWSTLAYCVAAIGVGSIAATLAEVSSQFRASGGVYLYCRVAFGRFVGIQIGWLMWLSRIAACSAIANLFISYLAQFIPAVAFGLVRAILLFALISSLAIVNYLGVAKGMLLNNFFAATKLILLMLFIVGGRIHIPYLDYFGEILFLLSFAWFGTSLLSLSRREMEQEPASARAGTEVRA